MASKNEIGKFRRSYEAKLQLGDDDQKRINALHLQIAEGDASLLKKSDDDNTFVCAIRVCRNPEETGEPLPANSSFPSTSLNQINTPESLTPSPKRSTVSTSVVTAEDIIVCVWAIPELSSPSPPVDDDTEGRSLSIDGDSSDDDNYSITLRCTNFFLDHYNISETDLFYIRSIEVFPLSKAIFSVSNSETYDWLQQDKFSEGLMEEICNHDLLVRKNDILLAPYPELFLDDPNFKRSWYFNIKAIACAPFQMGLIKSDTEIIIYFEKALTHLPTKHRHFSGTHIEQYVDMQNGFMISDFCRQLSVEAAGDTDSVITAESSFNDFFICSSFVIQQKIHWNKVLLQDEDVNFIDLTTAVGMPFKLMKKYGIIKGTIMKITLYQKDLTGDINRDDVKKFLKQEKLKQKFVRVYPLTKRLDDTDVLFISSLLLFNLQKEPPVIKSPLLILEKPPTIPRVGSVSEIDGGHQPYYRSVSAHYSNATEVLIKIINSPSYPPQAKHEESLSKYFQIPRLLSVGDVFVVNSTDDPEFWQEPAVDTGARKPVIFFKVFSISPHQPESFPLLADVNNTSLKQVGSDHSFVPLSASKYLSHCDAVYGQSIVCPGLDKYVTKLENFVLPYIYKRHRLNTLVPSVILSGSKGCGKRVIVNTVARRLYMHILEVNCHDIVSDVKTESRITSIFDSAIRYWPCIILMRNIDVIGREKEGASFESPRIINSFYNNVRKLVGQSNPIVIVATSSNISGLSEDLLPAFLHQINIESPTETERADIIQGLLENCVISPDISIGHLAQRTAGFVLGDLNTLILQAKQKTYEKVLKICCTKEKPASLQLEEDIVTAGLVMEQSDIESALDAMQSAHSDSIGAPKIPSVKWEDIGGLEDVKAEIIDTVQLPLQHPELLAAGLRRSGVLLYGPPGTGKTLLAKAVATECSLNFLSVKGPELINMYVGQSEENVREVFKRARNASPCVIFFDELDSLAPNRGRSGDSGGVMDRVVSQLLAELDGLHQSSDVFVIGATNRPDLLDPALLRPGRFDKLLYLGVSSDTQSQLNILEALTSKFNLAPELKLIDVAKKCPPNLTGADLYALCADAMLSAMRRKIQSLEAGIDTDQTKLEVGVEDFDTALSALVPSVSRAELEKYEQMRASFQP